MNSNLFNKNNTYFLQTFVDSTTLSTTIKFNRQCYFVENTKKKLTLTCSATDLLTFNVCEIIITKLVNFKS